MVTFALLTCHSQKRDVPVPGRSRPAQDSQSSGQPPELPAKLKWSHSVSPTLGSGSVRSILEAQVTRGSVALLPPSPARPGLRRPTGWARGRGPAVPAVAPELQAAGSASPCPGPAWQWPLVASSPGTEPAVASAGRDAPRCSPAGEGSGRGRAGPQHPRAELGEGGHCAKGACGRGTAVDHGREAPEPGVPPPGLLGGWERLVLVGGRSWGGKGPECHAQRGAVPVGRA